MNTSTKDEIKGTVHEVKGKVKETAGKVTNNPNLQAEGNAEKIPAKFRKRSDRSKKCSRSKSGGPIPNVLILLRTAGVPPVSAQFCRDPAVRQTSARSSSIG